MSGVRSSVRSGAALAAALAAAQLVAGPARAQEACIVCTEPAVTYRCAVEGAPLKANDARLQLACIAELAKSGGHASCSAGRKQPGTGCEGPLRTITLGEAAGAMAPPPTDAAAPLQAATPAPVKKGPPDTVVELAKRTADSSKEQLKKAGDGVSGAAKKTWRCLSSFFKEC